MRWRIACVCVIGMVGCAGGDRVADSNLPGSTERSAPRRPVVEGLKANWQLVLPEEWIGGNYNQLSEVANRTANLKLREISLALRDEARGLDAIVVHLNVQHVNQLTEIRLNVISPRNEWDFQALADLEMRSQGGGSAQVVRIGEVLTGNRRGREGIIEFSPLKGKSYSAGIRFVPLPDGQTHMISLTTDPVVFHQRYTEFQEMMKGLQYRY